MEEETTEPLLKHKENQFQRKGRSPIYHTIEKTSFGSLNKIHPDYVIDPKLEKEQNKFLFKTYIHLLFQSIIIFTLLFLTFKIELFKMTIKKSVVLYIIIIIILLITFIRPLVSDKILKSFPENYLYLSIFTLCFCYILCKIAIKFEFTLVLILSILNIIEILILTIESYITKGEKTPADIASIATFLGLGLLFIGSVVGFLLKIPIFKLSIILLILIFLEVYILYDMNCIFIDKRRKFQKDEYVLATIFIYVDIFQTLLELLEKFYNSCEPERKPIKRHTEKKFMIYTGDEDYKKLYRKEEDEKKSNENKENDLNPNRTHVRRKSSSDIKFKYKIKVPMPNIIESAEQEEENDEKENNSKEKRESSEDEYSPNENNENNENEKNYIFDNISDIPIDNNNDDNKKI